MQLWAAKGGIKLHKKIKQIFEYNTWCRPLRLVPPPPDLPPGAHAPVCPPLDPGLRVIANQQ